MHEKPLLVTENGTMRQDDVAMKSSVKAVLAVDVGGSSVRSSRPGKASVDHFHPGRR